MLKTIIFDMDGVLIDSMESWYTSFNETLYHFEKKKISKEEFRKKVWAYNFKETAASYFSVSKEEIMDHFRKTKDDFKACIFPEVKEVLEELSKKFKLAVATNTQTDIAKEFLKGSGIIEFFDYIIGADKVKEGKPSPDILLKTLDDLNLQKEEVIFVGDTIYDQLAAKKADIKFIGKNLDCENKITNLKELNVLI